MLAAGNYGVDASGNDTSSVPGLPLFNVNGTAEAPIVISGPATGPRPVLMGRSSHNTIRLANSSHVVIRRLEVNGRRLGGFGVSAQGPAHHITIDDNVFYGLDSDQQVVAISTTGSATWNWIIRRNHISNAGTGMYLGNSDGTSPFVAGIVEHNVIRDTIGYNIQIKHQVPWASVPSGMPTGATTTIVRNNVFSKSGNSSTGANARPNLLIGDVPPSGPGAANDFAIYGNFFYQNPSEALFQGEGRIALYNNIFVATGSAVRVQTHNGGVRDVRIVNNTVVAQGDGIAVSGGVAGSTQLVRGNAVFAGGGVRVTSTGGSATQNVVDTHANAANWLVQPDAAVGSLDAYPRSDVLRQDALDNAALASLPDAAVDFNGATRDPRDRGAYTGFGSNPGWRLAIDNKP